MSVVTAAGGVEAPPALAEPYTVTLEARDGSKHRVSAMLGPKVPTPKEGGGGWEEIPLPKRAGVLIWKGRTLMKIAFSLIFDGSEPERAIGPAHQTLRHMFRPDDPTVEPPVVLAYCAGDAVPYLDEGLQWVVSELEWGDAIADEQGVRIQQTFEVTLTEYRPDERLGQATGKPKRKKLTRYTIKRIDIAHGLGGIAGHLHIKGGWKALAAMQHPPRKDPRLRQSDVGKRLVIYK